MPVINRRAAGDRAGDVVEQFLCDMGWRTDRREIRRERSAEIMQCPGCDAFGGLVEVCFQVAPSVYDANRDAVSALLGGGENELANVRQACENLSGHISDREAVRAVVLCRLG